MRGWRRASWGSCFVLVAVTFASACGGGQASGPGGSGGSSGSSGVAGAAGWAGTGTGASGGVAGTGGMAGTANGGSAGAGATTGGGGAGGSGSTAGAGGTPGSCAQNSDCANHVCVNKKCSTTPLADAFTGAAQFQKDQTGLGAAFHMHFVSMESVNNILYAHYIDNVVIAGVGRSRVGLATSTDGVSFTNKAVALDIGGSWEQVYAAATDLSHLTGQAEADGWGANVAQNAANFLVYGPYAVIPNAAGRIVSFQLLVDSNVSHVPVVNLEVFDSTANSVLATKTLYRDDFTAANSYQIFNLTFTPTPGNKYEYRVYWHDTTATRIKQIAVATGKLPLWDDRLASFPGTFRDGSQWLMAYEGASVDGTNPGDVGLVQSSSPDSFVRQLDGPFLKHATSGWEKANIGTPTLHRDGATTYLYYHGFDGVDVQIGVATFSGTGPPVKYAQNPILPTSASGWDSGTVGARSHILSEGAYHYMAYEGSTDAPFNTANWSSGLARSHDYFSWQKSPVNPVIPVTSGTFGNDGPELVELGGRYYLYVRAGANATDRYALVGKP